MKGKRHPLTLAVFGLYLLAPTISRADERRDAVPAAEPTLPSTATPAQTAPLPATAPATPSSSVSDEVLLTDGSVVRGRIVREELGSFVVLERGDGAEVVYPWNGIRHVVRAPGSKPLAVKASPATEDAPLATSGADASNAPAPTSMPNAGGYGGRFQRFGLGVEGGALFPGSISVGGGSIDTGVGPFAAVYGDLIAGGFFSFGAYWAVASTSTEGGTSATLIDLAVSIKGRFSLSRTVQLRPGITFGYQLVRGDFENVQGFDPGLTLALAVGLSESTAAVVDLGFLSQPVGGNEATTVTFAPIGYAALGIELGK